MEGRKYYSSEQCKLKTVCVECALPSWLGFPPEEIPREALSLWRLDHQKGPQAWPFLVSSSVTLSFGHLHGWQGTA